MPALTRGDLLGADLVWALSLTLRGTTYYLSTDLSEPGGDDSPGLLPGGLSPVSWSLRSTPTDTGVGEVEVQLSLQWEAVAETAEDSWAASQALGWDLGDSTAELALCTRNGAWASRQVVLSGRVIEPEYGARGEGVSLTLAQDTADDRGRLISATMRLGEATFPASGTVSVPDSTVGFSYPFVLGYPGLRDSGATDIYPATPAPLSRISFSTSDNSVQSCDFLLSYGHVGLPSELSAGTVRIYLMNRYDPQAGALYTQDLTVTQTHDDLGVPVTIATAPVWPTTGVPLIKADDQAYAGWDGVGGIQHDGRTLEYAGDVVQYLLGRSSAPVAPVRRSIVDQLNGFRLAGYINAETTPWEVLYRDVLPLLPVSIIPGADGWRLLYWNVRATEADALEHIDTETMRAERSSRVRYTSVRGVSNLISIEYRVRADTGQPTETLYLAPEQWVSEHSTTGTGTTIVRSPIATESARRYGVMPARAVRSPMLWDKATAGAVASWMLRWFCQTRIQVEYTVPQHLQYLRPGDVVTLTDPGVSFDGRPFFVTGVSMGPGDQKLTLESIPDVYRTAPQG